MYPTAISEVMEAIFKLLVGLSAAYLVFRLGTVSYTHLALCRFCYVSCGDGRNFGGDFENCGLCKKENSNLIKGITYFMGM